MNLVELTIQVHALLEQAGITHAFGGALSLAYVADPRGTADIDVNAFVGADRIGEVVDALAELGAEHEQPLDAWNPSAGLRLRTRDGLFPIDIFVSLDQRYDEIARRRVLHPFGPDHVPLPFLSVEDLVVFKLSFGRDKDWVDLRAIARSVEHLDLAYIERQLLGLRGSSMHPRLTRLRRLVREAEAGA